MPSSLLDTLLSQPDFSRKSRLPSLFSDFSPLSLSNRDGYEANVQAWLTALGGAVWENNVGAGSSGGSRLCIRVDDALAEDLASRQWGRPLALACVEREAVRRGNWISIGAYAEQRDSIYDVPSGMFANLSVTGVIRWGLSHLFSPGAVVDKSTRLSGTTYVCVANLERLQRKMEGSVLPTAEAGACYSDYITTTTAFGSRIAKETGMALSTEELSILLNFLSRDRHRLIHEGDLIKFQPFGMKNPGSSSSSPSAGLSPVTETDVAISKLKAVRAQVETHVSALAARHDAQTVLLREQVRNSGAGSSGGIGTTGESKRRALATLRAQRETERQMQTCAERESQISAVLDKIDEAVAQVGMVDAMQAGSVALRSVMDRVGGIERVETVLDGVREQMDRVDEVQTVLSEAAVAMDEDHRGSGVDDEAVEAEYAALLESASRRRDEEELQEKQKKIVLETRGKGETSTLKTTATASPDAIVESVRETKQERAGALLAS